MDTTLVDTMYILAGKWLLRNNHHYTT